MHQACGQPRGPSKQAGPHTLRMLVSWLLHLALTGAHTVNVRGGGPQPLCSVSRKTLPSGPETASLLSTAGQASRPPPGLGSLLFKLGGCPWLSLRPLLVPAPSTPSPGGSLYPWHYTGPISLPALSPGSLSSSWTSPTPRRP